MNSLEAFITLYKLYGSKGMPCISTDEQELWDLIRDDLTKLQWRELKEYNRNYHDWVLVRTNLSDLPHIAEKRTDGKWYDRRDVCLDNYCNVIAWREI